jgi:hypothetical protein
MMFNATFNNISFISRGGQFYLWRKPEDPEKTTDLPQVRCYKEWSNREHCKTEKKYIKMFMS